MHPTVTAVDPSAPPPVPPQPPRSSFSCDRHPDEQFSGFCPSCLCERLVTLDKSTSNTPSSSRRPSSASATAAAIKALFSSSSSKPTTNASFLPPPLPPKASKTSSFFPELRRTKSFSASKNEALGQIFEPQRKSCDVRVRNSNTLWSLFALDDDKKPKIVAGDKKPSAFISQNQAPENPKKPVFEESENDEFHDPKSVLHSVADDGGEDEITPVLDSHLESLRMNNERVVGNDEIDEADVFEIANLKLMKDHIDLDTRAKKSSGGRFWATASVFNKKWQTWRQKQKMKRRNNGGNLTTLPADNKQNPRQYRETQSEAADYGFGRRSCDIDPRFSLDAGRISLDDPRHSFEQPRASWDGHLIGRSFPRMAPMVSVMEDSPTHVSRSDMQIPIEEPATTAAKSATEGEVLPGGSLQTREYYLDSSSRRRKSLDKSNSMRNTEASMIAEIDSKIMPTDSDTFHGAIPITNSMRDDYSDAFKLRNAERKDLKKPRSWSWRIWGFINRLSNGTKDDYDEKVNGFSESWQVLNREDNQELREGFNRKMFRSHSSVSWRNSNPFGGSFGSIRKSGAENGNKGPVEFEFRRNTSSRYSPSHFGNGPMRFYLTPMRSGRGGMLKPSNSNSISRSVLRLY